MVDAAHFWGFVDKTDVCWLWRGFLIGQGYGRYTVGKRPNRRQVRAHRVAWELTNGDIPEGQSVLHRCDVRACVRPDHLFLGSQAVNVADMVAKDRQSRGRDLPQARLSDDDVRVIRARAAKGEYRKHIAKDFGVTTSAVDMIVWHQRWKHVC